MTDDVVAGFSKVRRVAAGLESLRDSFPILEGIWSHTIKNS